LHDRILPPGRRRVGQDFFANGCKIETAAGLILIDAPGLAVSDNERAPASSDALDGWVRRHWPRAVAYARTLLREHQRAAAEDVVQDCFCALLRRADVYDLERDGVPLLMKSVSNACFKRNARTRPVASATGIDPIDEGAAEPLGALLGAELEVAIGAALARLPQAQRAAVELKSMGHSLQEIAGILGVSPTNAGVLIHRGRQELARLLAPFLGSEGESDGSAGT
jgi:RNA polymerase sigma-70 factor (ECF subfamily)